MAHWAKPGIKCVCINDQDWMAFDKNMILRTPDYWGFEVPVKGAVYTILDVLDRGFGPGALLEELANHPSRCRIKEPIFSLARFRPIVSKSDDIAMFQRIADKAASRVPEGV